MAPKSLATRTARSVARLEPMASTGPGRRQLRLTTPVASRIRRDSRGDILISLARGLAGKRREHVRTACHLGLRRFGDQVLVRRHNLAHVAMGLNISHLVTITLLPQTCDARQLLLEQESRAGGSTVPGTNLPLWVPDGADERSGAALDRSDGGHPPARDAASWVDTVKTVALSPGMGLTGGYYEFDNEEYVQVEVAADGVTIMWSSPRNHVSFAEAAKKALGSLRSDCYAWSLTRSGRTLQGTSADVAVKLRGVRDAALVELGFADSVVSWRQPTVKLRGGKVAHAEVAFSSESVDFDELWPFIASTATPSVVDGLARNRRTLLDSLGDATGA